jgi:hypothetical protein
MRIFGLLGAVIALSGLAPIAPIPAHANYIEIVNGEVTLGIGMPHVTAGTFDLADPDWSLRTTQTGALKLFHALSCHGFLASISPGRRSIILRRRL